LKRQKPTGVQDNLKRVPKLRQGEIPPVVTPAQDTGLQEAILLSEGLTSEQIERAQAASEFRRTEKFRGHFENIAVCGLWVFALALLVIGWRCGRIDSGIGFGVPGTNPV
jgi:hypothetical protein